MSGILTRALQPAAVERRAVEGALVEAILSGMSYRSTAGVAVTPDTALTYGAVYACVRVLAETLGSLPLITYRRLPGGGKERATDHPLYPLLHDAPNDEMTSQDWRETQMANMGLWGNCYSQIVRNGAGRPLQLWPMMSRYMQIERDRQNRLVYQTTEQGVQTPVLKADQMLHVRMMSVNGIQGLSPISLARQSIGLGLATETYGAAFFGNGASPGLVIEHPTTLSDDAYGRLKASIAEEQGGPSNAHKTMILEEGMKIDKIGVPPNDAQFLETRQWQVTEVARWFRIPPHLIGDLMRATFSNIEHQGLDFLIYTMRPWLTRWEQHLTQSLFTNKERGTYYSEFLVDALLRSDIVTRYNAYATARQWGWLSVDDVRAMENMNPIAGGDQYLTPLNMTSVAQQPPAQIKQDLGAEADVSANRALYPVYREAIERISRRAVADITSAAKKHLPGGNGAFSMWWNSFDADLRDYAQRSIRPIAQAQAELTHQAYRDPDEWIGRYMGELKNWMTETVTAARTGSIDPVEAVEDQLKHVDSQRIGEWARDIALTAGGQ